MERAVNDDFKEIVYYLYKTCNQDISKLSEVSILHAYVRYIRVSMTIKMHIHLRSYIALCVGGSVLHTCHKMSKGS